MNIAPNALDIHDLDMAVIDKHARQLRADAIRNWVKSVKALFSGLSFGAGKQHADA